MHFNDLLSGEIHADERLAREDFIIHRRDGLFAYNLAVVVDDHFQGVTEIVRGADLVEPTVRQISLYHQFGWTAPDYIHLPLAVNAQGLKMVKAEPRPGPARRRSASCFDRRAAISQPECNQRMAGSAY